MMLITALFLFVLVPASSNLDDSEVIILDRILILSYLCYFADKLHSVLIQQLGVCTDMDFSLLPVQLSVNIYMGNITYLRCPSFKYFLTFLLKVIIYVDSNLIITSTLAPND